MNQPLYVAHIVQEMTRQVYKIQSLGKGFFVSVLTSFSKSSKSAMSELDRNLQQNWNLVVVCLTTFEISKLLFNCPNKQSDPIPTWFLKIYASVLVPTVINIVNLSLSSRQFHPILNESTISPLLKKCTLDKDQLSDYHSISNLSLISRIIEHVVRSRLTVFLSFDNLLNPHQFAYYKHHSTETALLYIRDQLWVSWVCLKLVYILFVILIFPC